MPDRTSPDPYAPRRTVIGKPAVMRFPTPNLADRVYQVRKDSRLGDYTIPAKGDAYDGPNFEKYKDFKFATVRPDEKEDYIDWWYYVNERLNQDEYNFSIDYPYTDHDYPRYARTYVLLREDVVEPTSDDLDPVFNGEDHDGDQQADEFILMLTDHKQTRLEDPILDALFVGVTRVYERLPGPVITSYGQNAVKQIVTVETQAVEINDAPPISDATTESLKIDRETTAKATVIRGRVPEIYPATDLNTEWGSQSHGIPEAFRSRIPVYTTSQIVGGDALQPVLGVGDFIASETQMTEFTRRRVIAHFEVEHHVIDDHKVNSAGQVVLVRNTIDPADQTVDTGALVEDSSVRHIGDDATLKITETVPNIYLNADFENSKPDILPIEFRGAVPTLRSAYNVAGAPTANLPLGEGILGRRESEVTEFVKRIEITKRTYGDLPQELIDKKLTTEYGGGILDIIRTVDDTVLEPEEGYDVVSSFTKNLGDGLMVRETERVEGGFWPTLAGYDVEETGMFAGVKTDFLRIVVPANTTDPDPNPHIGHTALPDADGSHRVYTNANPIDKWRTLQIQRRIRLESIPAPYDEPTSAHISLPAQLVGIVGNWSNSGGKSWEADNNYNNSEGDGGRASVTVSSGATGSVGIIHRGGYNGIATGWVRRSFWEGPPVSGGYPINGAAHILASPVNIRPSAGFVTAQYGHENAAWSKGKGYQSKTFGGGITREMVHVNGLLNAGPGSTYPNYYILRASSQENIPPVPVAVNSGSTTAGTYTVQLVIGGPACFMSINIPLSTPPSIVSGQPLLWDARVIDWKHNIKVLEEVYYLVP